jgi:hypothetical protein
MTSKHRLGKGLALITGLAYGATMMYLLDPAVGRRRRAVIRDGVTHMRNNARWWLEHQLRNSVNHVRGSIAEMRARAKDVQVGDEILLERVRAQIGHVVVNASPLEIVCHHGGVLVRGPLFEGEREKIEQRLAHTRGVRYWSMEVREVPPQQTATPGRQDVGHGRERVG